VLGSRSLKNEMNDEISHFLTGFSEIPINYLENITTIIETQATAYHGLKFSQFENLIISCLINLTYS
jgi:hypothetical protein